MSVHAVQPDVVAVETSTAVPRELAPARRGVPWDLRIGVGLLAAIIGVSVVVRLLGLGHPYAASLDSVLLAPSPAHPFGTDNLGRDVLTRTLYATVTDVQVGVVTTIVPLLIGLAIGVLAGYFGGRVDTALMRVVDFVLAFPFIVLIMVVIVIFGPGLTGVYVGLVIKGFPAYARLTRGEMLVLREQQFILAARSLGFSSRRVVSRHALPHVIRPNLVYAPSDMLGNILLLASLSFLGLGVQPPQAEWGAIIADGQSYLLTAWWISTLPGVFVVLVGLGLNLTGEGLAEKLRVRTSGVA